MNNQNTTKGTFSDVMLSFSESELPVMSSLKNHLRTCWNSMVLFLNWVMLTRSCTSLKREKHSQVRHRQTDPNVVHVSYADLLKDVGSYFLQHGLGFVMDDIVRVGDVEEIEIDVHWHWGLFPHTPHQRTLLQFELLQKNPHVMGMRLDHDAKRRTFAYPVNNRVTDERKSTGKYGTCNSTDGKHYGPFPRPAATHFPYKFLFSLLVTLDVRTRLKLRSMLSLVYIRAPVKFFIWRFDAYFDKKNGFYHWKFFQRSVSRSLSSVF